MIFSERLRMLLDVRHTTWAEVSKILNIGRNQQKYWETHNSTPDGKTLVKLATYFEVSADYLLGIDSLKEKSLLILDDPMLNLTADEKWHIIKLRQLDKEGLIVVESALLAESRRVESERQENINAG